MRHFILHYGELALKNRNRGLFEETLKKDIAFKCSKIGPCKVRRLQGRLLLEFAAPIDAKEVKYALCKIFGLSNFIPCALAEATLEELKCRLGERLAHYNFSSFAVRARRADKNFPVSSQFVNEEIGRFVQQKTGAKVDLTHPQTTLHIELFVDKIFFGFEKIMGLGGLPTGMAGNVLGLLSGGIDSPVAAFRMMKRGCYVTHIHFHSAPFTQPQSLDKALELAEILSQYQNGGKLIEIPFGEIQRSLIAKTPEEYRVILYRRMMLRIAEKMASEFGCLGLITGESLSQVASQTLSNLTTIESAVDIPIFRPLIGMDKMEIVEEAKKIGTFELSTAPHEDCCSFMIPKHPKTRSTPTELATIEKDLDIDALVQKGVKESKIFDL